MKVKIPKGSIQTDDLKAKLEAQFPDMTFQKRNKKMLVAKRSNIAGANIMVYKNRVQIGAAFPTMGGQMLFVFSFLLLGILIPFIVYLAAFQPKQKEVEKDVGAFVQKLVEI
ncbi:MAG: hypothetical protein DCO96_09835 [Fluviicola sp. XM-24bin1]|nr:MAG: hypothetical protein DCO96_09835 [Fluviicola sp. XM-24bin1]